MKAKDDEELRDAVKWMGGVILHLLRAHGADTCLECRLTLNNVKRAAAGKVKTNGRVLFG